MSGNWDFLRKKKKISESEIAKNQTTITKIMKATGWSQQAVIEQVAVARSRIPKIGFKGYLNCEMYNVPVEQQQAVYDAYIENRERLKKSYVEAVAAKTGWTYEEAEEHMLAARKDHGVSFREYNKWNLFNFADEDIEHIRDDKRRQKEERKLDGQNEAREDREAAIEKTMAALGIDREAAIAKMQETGERTGCSMHEYGLYKLWEIDEDTQNSMFFMSCSKQLTKKYNIDKVFIDILFDKEASNEFFDKYMKRAWCVNTKISEDDFVEKFKNSKKVFYKPIDGHHGDGAAPFEITADNIHDVYRTLSGYSEGVVEEFVVQHHKMTELAPAAVNTVRVATISSKTHPVTEDGKHIDIAYTSLKMAGVDSVVDNLVNGGMVAGADLETGRLITAAIDIKGNTYEQHPATGTQIRGFEIPYYQDIKKLVEEVYEDKGIEGYLGWDIAITEDGPIIIEVNTTPGVILLQYPFVPERIGMKQIMTKYL